MSEGPKEIWAAVFARLLLSRISDPTWQATFTIPEDMSDNRCFNVDLVRHCTRSEDSAYYLFDTDFRHLRPDWQIILTGKTVSQWNDYDRQQRGVV